MLQNEEDSNDIAYSDSEAELGNDGHHALPGVRDVLREHQSKAGVPKAPNPDALVKHAKKLNGWGGPVNVADEEVNVRSFPLSISKSSSMLIVSLLRMVSVSPRGLLVQGNVGPRWMVKCESKVSISACL